MLLLLSHGGLYELPIMTGLRRFSPMMSIKSPSQILDVLHDFLTEAVKSECTYVKEIHEEYSIFLNQFFPTPCLYHELNKIIHTS